ncbi:sterol desaturase family protein [Paludifilum halophilum]|uniref:Fatty acid hydroxylase n=1 Tax=Paludifilum halophilum TaxID=1642702 RepID=A0A235B1Q8_9BACL|nr:sterol desaturase family protein [Paludifilum halophilum]OYD06240.1 fatty acid hydroxylase [Paludifilum halophilum]
MKRIHIQEFFTHFDIVATGLVFLAAFGWSLPHMGALSTWAAIGAGMLAYATSEYVIHRFLFHLKPPRQPWLLKLLKRLHYDHHADPDNLKLLFLPIWYSFPLIGLVGGAAYLLTADGVLTVAFVTGVVGYLLYYEWMHYIAHRPVKPLTPWGRWMKRMHLWHHFKNERYWFGVTHPLLDWSLGTWKDEKSTERSATVRNLERRGFSSVSESMEEDRL